jgi:hypothetical protein
VTGGPLLVGGCSVGHGESRGEDVLGGRCWRWEGMAMAMTIFYDSIRGFYVYLVLLVAFYGLSVVYGIV